MTDTSLDPRPDFVYVVYIAAPQEKVWNALTDETVTEQYFFRKRVHSDWRVGSPVQLIAPDNRITEQGVVLAYEPTRLLSYTWERVGDQAQRQRSTEVTYKLDTVGAATRLTLSHSHLVVTDVAAVNDLPNGINNGWPMVLACLKSFLETGRTPDFRAEAVVDDVRAAR